MKEEFLINDIKIIKRVLDRLKIPFFLNFGTLLGVYRDGGFIPEDKDMDIGILGQERKQEICDALKEEGFTHRVVHKHIPNLYMIKEAPVDIHLFKKVGEEYIEGASIYKIPKRFIEFKKIKFLGRNFLIPKNTEEYLEYYYGNWRIPSHTKARRN